MKKLIIILLLSPLCSKAQIKFNTDTSLLKLSSTHFGYLPYGTLKGVWESKPFFFVKNSDQKIIAEVDTLGNLKVYGDTTTVLKAIIRNFGMKVN